MVAIQDAWAQAEVAERAKGVQAELGWVLHPDHQGYRVDQYGLLRESEIEELIGTGAVGDMLGKFFNAAGRASVEQSQPSRTQHSPRQHP